MFRNLTYNVTNTSSQKYWENSGLRETRQIRYHLKGNDDANFENLLISSLFILNFRKSGRNLKEVAQKLQELRTKTFGVVPKDSPGLNRVKQVETLNQFFHICGNLCQRD